MLGWSHCGLYGQVSRVGIGCRGGWQGFGKKVGRGLIVDWVGSRGLYLLHPIGFGCDHMEVVVGGPLKGGAMGLSGIS